MFKQVCRGVPYVKNEVGRALSVRTNRVFATPQVYYIVYGFQCNAACTFCFADLKSDVKINKEAMLRIVREARELSGTGFHISLSGGEPLIYEPLFETLELAHRLNVNLGFTTNGYLLTRQNVAKALEQEPFNINVSLESITPEINEKLRPRKNGTQQTLEGIDHLVTEKRRRGSRVSTLIKPTVMEQNYRTLPELVRYFDRYPEVQVSPQPYMGVPDSGFWIEDVDEFERVTKELCELRKAGSGLLPSEATLNEWTAYFSKRPQTSSTAVNRIHLNGIQRGCDIGYRSLEILANGSVHFCDLLERPIGSIYEQSLKDIYYGEVARRVRKRINYCDIDCQCTCQRPIPLSTKVRAFLRMG
jgi:MoaA/NifB/PqqE/SkfB family radical SAM enzyme